MKAQLLIAAAGPGLRLGYDLPKALIPIDGVPLVAHTLRRFEALDLTNGAVVAVPSAARDQFEVAISQAYPDASITLIDGGAERQDSVENLLAAVRGGTELVIIHDAARPFVAETSIRETMEAAEAIGAATLATPCVDTILIADDAAMLQSTPERSGLWACQTPQIFRTDIIREAYSAAHDAGATYTDDASLVRAAGHAVRIVTGSAENFKITTPHDLAFATQKMREEKV